MASETWRREAYCPKHGLGLIQSVKNAGVINAAQQVYEAKVILACGDGATIITTGRNLQEVANG